ncbi:MAG: NDP-sugar synthase [Elusimicrobiota bacterium]
MRAIVLAAGLATRMRPLTDRIPKALIPVLGRPLLGAILDNLAAAGADPIVVNTHHLAGRIEEFAARLPGRERVVLSHEPLILGSGGALVKARSVLAEEDLFVYHNADELTDLDLRSVIAAHEENRARGARSAPVATLALADHGPENKVMVSREGEVLDIAGGLGVAPPSGGRTLAFTGIAVLSREIFDYLPAEERFASVMDALRKAMAARPGCVRAFAPGGFYWSNLEDVSGYLDAHRDILVKRLMRRGDLPEGPFHIGLGAEVSSKAELSGFVSVGSGCTVEAGAALEDSVLLEGAVVRAGESRSGAVVGDGFVVTERARA